MDNSNSKSKPHRGPQLRLARDDEHEESDSASTSFEDIISEIQGKSKPLASPEFNAKPMKSQLARELTHFADELDKQIAALLAL
ncbi:MAG: hypothetical protein H7249_13290 [Chitinophagaceae bacterium]|nr:hypothetical protein [Oligoflexus sp.]